MPAALYGISFKDTGNLLAVASFENQALADDKAADALLAKLVGDKLQIAIGGMGALEVSASVLAVDLIDAKQDFERVVANAYGYRLELEAGKKKPGDGQPKTIKAASSNVVTSIDLKTTKEVVVTLTVTEGPIGQDAYLLFEGLDPIPGKTKPNANTATFALDPSVVLDTTQLYRCLFIKQDVRVTPAYVAPT